MQLTSIQETTCDRPTTGAPMSTASLLTSLHVLVYPPREAGTFSKHPKESVCCVCVAAIPQRAASSSACPSFFPSPPGSYYILTVALAQRSTGRKPSPSSEARKAHRSGARLPDRVLPAVLCRLIIRRLLTGYTNRFPAPSDQLYETTLFIR